MSKSSINKAISSFVILLVLILAVGAVGYVFKDNITSATTFITFEDKKIKDNQDIELLSDVENKFSLTNIDSADYTVKIVPNILKNKDVDFMANESLISFQSITDLTDSFNIVKAEKEFSITIATETTFYSILKKRYPTEIITEFPTSVNTTKYAYFKIIIVCGNTTLNIPIKFNTTEYIAVEDVKLDKETILF